MKYYCLTLDKDDQINPRALELPKSQVPPHRGGYPGVLPASEVSHFLRGEGELGESSEVTS